MACVAWCGIGYQETMLHVLGAQITGMTVRVGDMSLQGCLLVCWSSAEAHLFLCTVVTVRLLACMLEFCRSSLVLVYCSYCEAACLCTGFCRSSLVLIVYCCYC